MHWGTHLPEVLKTFGETNNVLNHVSGEVSHVWKSSENTAFPDLSVLLVLLLFKGARENGGGWEGGEVPFRLVVLTRRKDVSVYRLKKEDVSQTS